MRKFLISLFFLVQAMTAHAGNFFPPEYKEFPFKEGDLLASKSGDSKFAVNKILKVDRIEIRKGSSINIRGKIFTAPEDDYLLIVSASYGESEFDTLEQARAAAGSGKWTVKIAQVPNRAPGAAVGQTRVGNAPVSEAELADYREWRNAFDKGKAGVF